MNHLRRQQCDTESSDSEEVNFLLCSMMKLIVILNKYYIYIIYACGKFKKMQLKRSRRIRTICLIILLTLGMPALAIEIIKIGQSLNMGPNSDGGGLRIQSATKAYIETINSAGGVQGKRIELISLNDNGDLNQHANNLKTLIAQRGVVALLNCENESVCRITAEIAAQFKIPLVGPMSGAKYLNRSSAPLIFQIRPEYQREALALMNQLKAMACFRIALITDATSSEQVADIKSIFTNGGTDVTVLPLAVSAKNAGPDLLKNLEKGGYHAAVLVLNLSSSEWLLDQKLTDQPEWPRLLSAPTSSHLQILLNGFKGRAFGFTSMVPNPEIESVRLVQEFQRDLAKYGAGNASTFLGMEAYINIKVLVEGIKRVRNINPDAISIALSELQNIDLGGFYVSFASGRDTGSNWVDVVVRSRHGTLLR